jgi:hypothetical protein
MEYEFAIRPNSYAGTTRELVLTIPNVRSPIVGGEFRTFYEVSGNWFLYGINQFFDYRSSGGSDQVDYLDCRNRLMMAKTLRINVQVPTNGTRVAMFAIFHSINRSNLVIGGLAGTSDMAPPCALDLELLCDGAACSRSLVNFTSGITRVCGLPLN